MVDFVRKATKKSLLSMLRRADRITPRLLARLFEGVLFKDEYETFSAGGGLDHGALGGLTDDDHTRYLDKDGTRALTGDWDAGAYEIRAKTLESDVATGTAPLTVASTTKVTNLNADLVDGVEEASFAYRNGTRTFTGDITIVDGTDPALFLRESGSATNYTKIYDDGVDLFNIVKYTPSSSANLFFSPIPSDGSSDAVMALFYNTSTTGSRVLNVYDGSAGQNVQHQLNAGTGDVDLCQQAGQVTIGGTAGAEKLTVTGDASVSTDLSVDTVNEYTGAAGVTIDGVLVKDGGATLSAQFAAPVITQTSATLTLGATHYTVLCDGTSNTVTITLPAASGCSGRIYNIKAINIDNAVTVDQTGAETIDDSTDAITLDLMEVITVQSDGTNWWII